ncbi:hypothetical protein [Bradyrhizobium barranii]
MTPPVEWHDNEPESPDFLPPKREMSLVEALERLEGVLKAAGIRADIYNHNEGVDIDLTFPDGATFKRSSSIFILDVDGYSR